MKGQPGMNEKKNIPRKVGVTEDKHFMAMENLQEIQRLPSINPVNLDYFGTEQCKSGDSFGPYVRVSNVIQIVRSGAGELHKNGNVWHIRAGEAFVIYPGEDVVYRADRQSPWCYMWVGFHGLRCEELVHAAGFSPEAPVITCREISRLIQTMEGLLSCRKLTYTNDLMRIGYLYQLFAIFAGQNEVKEEPEKKQEDADSLYVETAVNLLINADDPLIKVGDVARTIGISRGYLTSIFKKKMKISPQAFQIKYRMERAGDLLRSTDSPVSVIAEKLGYMDVLSFSKSFRRHFGMSPTAFRKDKLTVVNTQIKGSFTSDHPL